MQTICKVCALYPDAHSFREIGIDDTTVFLYTKPADAKSYDDTEGILHHYKNLLDSIDGAKWIWVFDMKNFSVKHLLNIYLFYRLSILISLYNDTLQYIYIINPNQYMSHLLSTVLPFLISSLRDKIKKIHTQEDAKDLPEFVGKYLN